jgi:hypothetical protein
MVLFQPEIFWILVFLFAFIYPLIYPRVLIAYTLSRISILTNFISSSINEIKNDLKKKMKKNQKFLDEVLEYFVIQPTSLDPFGIVKKFEHLINKSEERLKKFVKDKFEGEEEEILNTKSVISILIELNFLKKVLEHYAETLRKYKNLQLALLFQMVLPMYEKISQAFYKGAIAISKNSPIGDGIGPLVISKMIDKKDKIKEIDDCILVVKKIRNKRAILIRAKGPGSRVGKINKVFEKVLKIYKPKKLITIDAARKLEGEKTGSIARGIGVAIGGIGVEKFQIEELSTKYNIDLDAIVIKMSEEEAIKPMNPEIFKASNKVIEMLSEIIEESEDPIVIIGVGNSAGVPNVYEDELERKIKETWEKFGKDEEEKKSFIDRLLGID